MSEMNEMEYTATSIDEAQAQALDDLGSSGDGAAIVAGGIAGLTAGSLGGYKVGYAAGVNDVIKANGLKKSEAIKAIKAMKAATKKKGIVERFMNKLGFAKIEEEPEEPEDSKKDTGNSKKAKA